METQFDEKFAITLTDADRNPTEMLSPSRGAEAWSKGNTAASHSLEGFEGMELEMKVRVSPISLFVRYCPRLE